MKKIIFIISLFFLTGCAEDMMYYNLNEYKKIAPNISLGDDQDKVLGLLLPIQEDLPQSWKRPPEQFMIKNDAYYIHFHRTGWVSDDRLTDDESTPYVFKNKKLVSIGWQALGGIKTTGAANSSSNSDAAAWELIRQGQEMMKSPAPSLPRTQTCNVRGTGVNRTVTCW